MKTVQLKDFNQAKCDHAILDIKDKVPEDRRLTQLAEECAEGAQAALKLFRAYTGNEPQLNDGTLRLKLLEEIADIFVCVDVFWNDLDRAVCMEYYEAKLKRWEDRLNGRTKS